MLAFELICTFLAGEGEVYVQAYYLRLSQQLSNLLIDRNFVELHIEDWLVPLLTVVYDSYDASQQLKNPQILAICSSLIVSCN